MKEIEFTISRKARRTLGFLETAALTDLDVRFGLADPSNPFATLRLNYRESRPRAASRGFDRSR